MLLKIYKIQEILLKYEKVLYHIFVVVFNTAIIVHGDYLLSIPTKKKK